MKYITWFFLSLSFAPFAIAQESPSAEPMIYGVTSSLPMGLPGEVQTKDYYLTAGRQSGVKPGSEVIVYRRLATYNLVSKRLQKDMTFPIATLKIIHSESNSAIARLIKMSDDATAPVIEPKAVMVGDLVQLK